MQDKLIYGKNEIQKVVSIEVEDDLITVYKEDESPVFLKNKFWILAPKPLRREFTRLDGNLHYKYGICFNTRAEFNKYRHIWRNEDTYSVYNAKEAVMIKQGITSFKGMKHQEVSVLSFDIESTSLMMDRTAHALIISNTFRKNGKIERKLFCYDEYDNEGQMVEAWCAWVRTCDPSIIIGHNIYTYDLPYLSYIASRYGNSLNLGRDSSSIKYDQNESKFRKDATQFIHYRRPNIFGRELVDTMFLSIKYDVGRKYESYALKKIIDHEGLEVKDRQHYDAASIRDNYKDPVEWSKIKKYAIHDADDALALYDLMVPPFFYLAQTVPKPFQSIIESASGSQINAVMVRAYLQDNHSLPKASESIKFEGAISIGNPGIYRNIFKIDVASLYPSVMIEEKVYDKNKDPKGYFLHLVETFTNERLKNKELAKDSPYHDALQSSQKIFINSCYGFLGAKGLLFNSPMYAEFITKTGREILTKCMNWAKSKDFTLCNADTDSISFCNADQSFIDDNERKKLLLEVNSLYPKRISWTDDGYYPKVVVLKAKNYVLYDGKKIKIKGSALKATNKEPALKEFIKECINMMVEDKDEFPSLYMKYVKEILDVKDIKRWASKKTITDKVLTSERTNESKVRDALVGSEYVEGDKVYMFFKSDSSLSLVERFNGDYHKDKLFEKLYKTSMVFDALIITEEVFPNFKLRRNKELLGLFERFKF